MNIIFPLLSKIYISWHVFKLFYFRTSNIVGVRRELENFLKPNKRDAGANFHDIYK